MTKNCCSFFALFMTILTLSACHHHETITPKDLLHHRFVIVEFDQQQISTPTTLEFAENLFINGHICNTFAGQGLLNNDTLTMIPFRSTEMLCQDEQLNQLETIMYNLLEDGANITQYELSGNDYLELKNSQHRIRLKLSDLM